MDKLKDMLTMDPCYEQHIVSIKDIYEKHLFSILTPAIYEGFQSLYRRAYDIEQKYVIASRKNSDIENPGILVIFQTLIREIPNLGNIKIRDETDRIKSSTKSAELFDDLVRAVCKSNIILLTYNVDHKRKDLIKTKYHENIIIYDFIHSCYNHCARLFYTSYELFDHKLSSIQLNQNKRACYKIIKEGIEEGIRMMLPMKDILLEYNIQKYEQKEKNYFSYPHDHAHGFPQGFNQSFNQNFNQGHPGMMGQLGQFDQGLNQGSMYYPQQSKLPSGVDQDDYVDVNKLLERDLQKYQICDNNSLLEDDYDPDNNTDNDDNFGPDNHSTKTQDFSLLLSGSSDGDNETDNNNSKKSAGNHSEEDESSNATNNEDNDGIINDEKNNDKLESCKTSKSEKTDSNSTINAGLKMIDISGSISKKGAASTYFNETMPDIKKRMHEYKQNKTNNKNDIENITITRSQTADASMSQLSSSDKDAKRTTTRTTTTKNISNADVDNMVDDLLKS